MTDSTTAYPSRNNVPGDPQRTQSTGLVGTAS